MDPRYGACGDSNANCASRTSEQVIISEHIEAIHGAEPDSPLWNLYIPTSVRSTHSIFLQVIHLIPDHHISLVPIVLARDATAA